MTPARLRAVARANALLILVAVLAAAGWGWLSATRTPVRYAATASVGAAVDGLGSDEGALRRVTLAASKVPEYAALATSDSFIERVIVSRRLPTTSQELRQVLTVSSPKDSGLVAVTVTVGSAAQAALTANAVANELAVVIPEREENLPMRVSVVAPAAVPGEPIGRYPVAWLLQYTVVGLVVGGGLAALREAVRGRRPRNRGERT